MNELTLEEVREQLATYGYSPEDFDSVERGMEILEIEWARDRESSNVNFDDGGDFEVVNDAPEDSAAQELAPEADPTQESDGWTDFLLSKLKDNEMHNGYPKLRGLRRLARKFLGETVESNSSIVQTPDPSNNRSATVTHSITLKSLDMCTFTTFAGSADASVENCFGEFAKHPVAIAETRAEARAYRRALQLDIVSAEEMSGTEKVQTVADVPNEEKITRQQIQGIDILCRNNERGMNINVEKLVKHLYPNYNRVSDVSFTSGADILKTLGTYQQNNAVPPDVHGYDADWRNRL